MSNCFSQLGLEVPLGEGGGLCPCGEFVRFDIVHRRIEHFLLCTVVDALINESNAPLYEYNDAAVRLGQALMVKQGGDT